MHEKILEIRVISCSKIICIHALLRRKPLYRNYTKFPERKFVFSFSFIVWKISIYLRIGSIWLKFLGLNLNKTFQIISTCGFQSDQSFIWLWGTTKYKISLHFEKTRIWLFTAWELNLKMRRMPLTTAFQNLFLSVVEEGSQRPFYRSFDWAGSVYHPSYSLIQCCPFSP